MRFNLAQIVLLVFVGALIGPLELNATNEQLQARAANGTLNAAKPAPATSINITNKNSTAALGSKPPVSMHKVNSRLARSVKAAESYSVKTKSLGDPIGLETALDSHRDLTPAAGEHGKKYILVKKKPKHKKIKMEVYKPKITYKKIKMKVPVKKMKKKKVKGYLVKKHKHY